MPEFDVIVVGGGAAGLTVAVGGAGLGLPRGPGGAGAVWAGSAPGRGVSQAKRYSTSPGSRALAAGLPGRSRDTPPLPQTSPGHGPRPWGAPGDRPGRTSRRPALHGVAVYGNIHLPAGIEGGAKSPRRQGRGRRRGRRSLLSSRHVVLATGSEAGGAPHPRIGRDLLPDQRDLFDELTRPVAPGHRRGRTNRRRDGPGLARLGARSPCFSRGPASSPRDDPAAFGDGQGRARA